ncbi:MAG: exodeoxyribonuclease III [Candidatus Zhuqueibacterota bacterium]
MKTLKMVSWNVNGIRAVFRKGAFQWLLQEGWDMFCLQETKAHPDQLSKEIVELEGYSAWFASAERKGYSGVALYTREKPLTVTSGFGEPRFDSEGRILIADYGRFVLFNIYYPNGKGSKERLAYKMEFYDAFLDYADRLKQQGRSLIVCGDVNTAHKEIDLARPRENEKSSGFLPEERAWIDRLLSHGFVDTFRLFHSEQDQYTWWDMKTRARERNIGWRIDYFYVSEDLRDNVKAAYILPDVMGSDHCPIGIDVEV